MRLGVPLYEQTTDFTCGAAATLTVWRYFDGNVQLSKRNEFLIWTEIVALPFKFSSPYRIAAFFIKKGFETKLIMRRRMSDEGKILLECCQTDPAEARAFHVWSGSCFAGHFLEYIAGNCTQSGKR